MMRRLATGVLVAVLAARMAAADPVRMFAVGHRQRLSDAVTYQTFHDKMAAMMDATFPGRSALVEPGVDDVASHLRPADVAAPPNALVVFPEDTGLLAAFIGTRGASARSQTSSTSAILSLYGAYGPQINYYTAKYPGQPIIRYLVLALTDTFYRAVYETFGELATTHGVYLAVSVNEAPAHRVEQADDPSLVSTLRDPDEPVRTYAYEATSPLPVNTTLVFAPDGQILVPDGTGGTLRAPSQTGGGLRGTTAKAYLTPIEQPPPGQAAGLSLAFGPVRDMDVIDTPVGRLGIVISKDAWMVDVNDRLLAKGANVILQPEAFDSWAFTTTEWEPDVFKEGGFANLQKNAPWIANVDASLTGNLFEITFDGQSALLGRKQKASAGPLSASNAWIGQNPDTGFLAIAPWIAPDPGVANPAMTLADRRTALVGAGTALEPGSGTPCGGPLDPGACEDGYRESVVWADVDVPTGPYTSPIDTVRAAPPLFGPAVRASGDEPTPIAQHAPRIATRGRRVYVVWQQGDARSSAVYLAVSGTRGNTFRAPIKVSDNPVGTATELAPAIAIRGGRIAVVWQEFASPGNDDSGRIKLARFSGRGVKIGNDVRIDDHDGSGKWTPAVAWAGLFPVVAWIDERDLGPEGEPLEHVYLSRGSPNGAVFSPAVRVDAGAPVPLALHNDNKWSPTVAANGLDVYVAWSDFRNADWDIFIAHSGDAGSTFGDNVQVDDFPNNERLDERPSIAIAGGSVHVAWTDLRAREPDTNVFYARSVDHAATFTPNRQLDDSKVGFDPDTDTPSNQWAPVLVADHGTLFAAWQDNRLGNDDIFFSRSTDGGASFVPAERVDDTGAGTSEQTRPSLAVSGLGTRRVCYVAWEDDRNGNPDVYVARRPCPQ